MVQHPRECDKQQHFKQQDATEFLANNQGLNLYTINSINLPMMVKVMQASQKRVVLMLWWWLFHLGPRGDKSVERSDQNKEKNKKWGSVRPMTEVVH